MRSSTGHCTPPTRPIPAAEQATCLICWSQAICTSAASDCTVAADALRRAGWPSPRLPASTARGRRSPPTTSHGSSVAHVLQGRDQALVAAGSAGSAVMVPLSWGFCGTEVGFEPMTFRLRVGPKSSTGPVEHRRGCSGAGAIPSSAVLYRLVVTPGLPERLPPCWVIRSMATHPSIEHPIAIGCSSPIATGSDAAGRLAECPNGTQQRVIRTAHPGRSVPTSSSRLLTRSDGPPSSPVVIRFPPRANGSLW